MKKEILRAIHEAVARTRVQLVSINEHQGHSKVTVRHEGREKTFVVSGTPKNLDYLANNIANDIKRFIKGIYT